MKLITPRRVLVALVMAASLALAACGSTAPSSTSSSGAGAAGNASCPNTAPASRSPANVVVHGANAAQPIHVSVGQILELQLPFGRSYALFPSGSNTILTELQPSDFPDASVQSCIFRFKATQSGTTALVFISRPVCSPKQQCPQNIQRLAIPVQVQG